MYTPETDMAAAMITAEGFMIGAEPKECRKLAAWLIKAADYLEAKEK